MQLEVHFPQKELTPNSGQTFRAKDLPALLPEVEIVDPSLLTGDLRCGSRDAVIVMTDEYGIRLTAFRAHHAGQRFIPSDLSGSPHFELSVLRGMIEAEARVPAHCLEGARTILKGTSAGRFNVLTLAHALACMEAGLAVIDVHSFKEDKSCTCTFGNKTWCSGSPGKHPRGPGWQDRASKDWKTVRSWWDGTGCYDVEGEDGELRKMAGAKSPRNVGIAFREGDGLFAVDVDGDRGKEGLAALEAEYGALPETPTSVSGSGKGYHKIFRAPKDVIIRNSVSSLAPGVDIRGVGGQIVAPPSLHASGNLYCWEDGRAPWEIGIADATDWLIEKAMSHSQTTSREKTPKPRKARARSGKRAVSPVQVGPTFRERLAQIGDGEGQLGFHQAINNAAIQYFRENGI